MVLNYKFLIVFIVAIHCFFFHSQCLAKSGKPLSNGEKRVSSIAVIDASSNKDIPEQLFSLLEVELSNSSNIDLLERESLEKILDEQRLVLNASTSSNPKTLIRCGQLIKTDAFLMLDRLASKNAKEKQRNRNVFRIRLIESEFGVKLADYTLKWDIANDAFFELLKKQVQGIINQLKKLPLTDSSTLLIGVTDFSSEEISNRWNWIGETIASGLENNLIQHPQVMVLERAKTAALSQERSIVTNLPETLKAGMILISGSYRIFQDKEGDRVRIALTARRRGKTFSDTLEISLKEIHSAPSLLTSRLLKQLLGKKMDAMATKDEAGLLISEVDFFKDEPRKVLSLIEAALALCPDNCDYHNQRIVIIGKLLSESRRSDSQLRPKKLRELIQKAVHSQEYILNCAPKKLGHLNDNKTYNSWAELFGSTGYVFNLSKYEKMVEGNITKYHQEIVQHWYWPLYRKLRRCFLSKNDPALMWRFLSSTRDALHFCYSLKEAFTIAEERSQDSLNFFNAIGLLDNTPFTDLVALMEWDDAVSWPRRQSIGPEVISFLEKKSNDKNPYISFMAATAALKLYQDKSEKITEKHAEWSYVMAKIYFAFLINVVRKREPKHRIRVENHWFLNSHLFSLDPEKDQKLKMELYEKALNAAIDNLDLSSDYKYESVFNILSGYHNDLVDYYISRNKIGKAELILEKVAEIYKNTRYSTGSRRARERLETLRRNRSSSKVIDYHGKRKILLRSKSPEVLSLFSENPKKRAYYWSYFIFEKLLQYRNNLFIIIRAGRDGREKYFSTYSVIKYDLNSEKIVDSLSLKIETELKDNGIWKLCAINDGNQVYFSVTGQGLYVFDFDNHKCKLLTEKQGLVSNDITSMTFLNNKIYATAGNRDNFTHGLMAVDPASGKSQLLLSPHSRKPKCEIDGQNINIVIADPKCGDLIVLAKFRNEEWDKTGVYKFDPTNYRTKKPQDFVENQKAWECFSGRVSNNTSFYLDEYPEYFILFPGRLKTYVYSKTTSTPELIISELSKYSPRWVNKRNYGVSYSKVCLIGQDLLTYGMNLEIFLWKDKRLKPIKLNKEKLFPKDVDKRVKQIRNSSRGVLFMSQDTVFLVPTSFFK